MELQGRVSTACQHLLRGGEGVAVREKDTSATRDEPSGIVEYRYLNMVTSFNITIFHLSLVLVISPYIRSCGHEAYSTFQTHYVTKSYVI